MTQATTDVTTLRLPRMSLLETEILSLLRTVTPQDLYGVGFEELAEKILIPSKENLENALQRITELKKKAPPNDSLAYKFLDSLECRLRLDEPGPDIGVVTDVLALHLVKEGFNVLRLKKLCDLLASSLNASLRKFEGKDFPIGAKLLAQYLVLGAFEILDVLQLEGKWDPELLESVRNLRSKVTAFRNRFAVDGFNDGQFERVLEIMGMEGAKLGRQKFYPYALRSGFDYKESPLQLERKAISWINEDLPKLRKATKVLAKELGCDSTTETVKAKLKERPGVSPKEALAATIKMRPVIQDFVAESIVGMNPNYDCVVVETPPYLTATMPTAAANSYDVLTDSPKTRYFLTTDEKRAPPSGFADLACTLVHEEYGHCLHFSNTAFRYAAEPTLLEIVNSLHSGPTSEGLAFQRELEFLDALHSLQRKKPRDRTRSERALIDLTKEYGGFDYVMKEIEFETYRMRIIRFLRVVGDSRINSAKQDLPEFLKWAEKKTGLSQRSVFYQIFPAHEAIFPGYATCYAVVGQEIRAIEAPFRNDSKKLSKFNAYACSMGFPPRTIYVKRLKEYADRLRAKAGKSNKGIARSGKGKKMKTSTG